MVHSAVSVIMKDFFAIKNPSQYIVHCKGRVCSFSRFHPACFLCMNLMLQNHFIMMITESPGRIRAAPSWSSNASCRTTSTDLCSSLRHSRILLFSSAHSFIHYLKLYHFLRICQLPISSLTVQVFYESFAAEKNTHFEYGISGRNYGMKPIQCTWVYTEKYI